MAELKTKATGASVEAFLERAAGTRMDDCRALVAMFTKATRAKPKMWGPSIIGFGSCKYRYPDGREMDWMLGAFSPRKTDLVVYLMGSFPEKQRQQRGDRERRGATEHPHAFRSFIATTEPSISCRSTATSTSASRLM